MVYHHSDTTIAVVGHSKHNAQNTLKKEWSENERAAQNNTTMLHGLESEK